MTRADFLDVHDDVLDLLGTPLPEGPSITA
jgi:hypothetical protein